jgi:hypothetical protein
MRDRDIYPKRVIYDAVLSLRRAGKRVYRHPDHDRHEVDGSIVSTSWLMEMARVEGQHGEVRP